MLPGLSQQCQAFFVLRTTVNDSPCFHPYRYGTSIEKYSNGYTCFGYTHFSLSVLNGSLHLGKGGGVSIPMIINLCGG